LYGLEGRLRDIRTKTEKERVRVHHHDSVVKVQKAAYGSGANKKPGVSER